MNCSCGNNETHIVARRTTADGAEIVLWSDGDLTRPLGFAIPGVGRLSDRALALRSGRLVLEDLCLYQLSEVSTLVKAARWAARRDSLPGTMRARFDDVTRSRGPRLVWTTIQADRDGRATVRVAKLPRLLYGRGYAVFHERGRYDVVRENPLGSGSYENTGFRARTLRELGSVLEQVKVRS